MTTSPFLAPHRDRGLSMGRVSISHTYVVPSVAMTSFGSGIHSTNDLRYSMWYTSTPIVVDRLAVEVTSNSSSGTVRMGFYAADSTWQPVGPPLADSGTVSTSTNGVKTYTPSTPIHVPPGRYLSVTSCGTESATFRVFQGTLAAAAGSFLISTLGSSPNGIRFSKSQADAAFATPGVAWDSIAQGSEPDWHYVVYRLSAA